VTPAAVLGDATLFAIESRPCCHSPERGRSAVGGLAVHLLTAQSDAIPARILAIILLRRIDIMVSHHTG
jgi:hypothetical protein